MKLHWIALSLIAVISFSVMVTLITFLSRKGLSTSLILFALAIVLTVTYFIQTLASGGFKIEVTPTILVIMLLIGILSAVGNWAQFQAAADAPNPGLAIAIVNIYAGITAILAVVAFKDKLTPAQMLGLIVALIGVVIISLGGQAKSA